MLLPKEIMKDMFVTTHVVDVRAALDGVADKVKRVPPFGDFSKVHIKGANDLANANYTARMEVVHIISTCVFDSSSAQNSMQFHMCKSEYDKLRCERRVFVVPFAYDNWLSIAVPKPLRFGRALSTI